MKDLGVKDYTLNLMVATGTFISYLSVSLRTYVVILYLSSTYLPTYLPMFLSAKFLFLTVTGLGLSIGAVKISCNLS